MHCPRAKLHDVIVRADLSVADPDKDLGVLIRFVAKKQQLAPSN